MAKDFAALETALETDPRYDAAVRHDPILNVGGKSLQPIMALLNEEDPDGDFVYTDVSVADVLDAAPANKLKNLTADQRARLQVLKQGGDIVALSRPGIRAELLDVFQITEAQLATGLPVVRRRPRYGEAFGFDRVTKEDLWQVLPQITKSYMAQYRARG